MLNPIPNLPVLIGYHRHTFTKQRIVGELGIVRVCVCEDGGVVDKATQGAPKWPTLDKTKASLTEPVQKEKKGSRIMPSLSSTVSTSTRESTIARARLS